MVFFESKIFLSLSAVYYWCRVGAKELENIKNLVICSLIQFLANFQYLAMSTNLAKGQKGIGEKASS